MCKQIMLNAKITFAENLSFCEAIQAITLARRSKAGYYYEFGIDHTLRNGYALVGVSSAVSVAFMDDPQAFVISLNTPETVALSPVF